MTVSEILLWDIALAEAGLLALACLILLGHGFRSWLERERERNVMSAQDLLVEAALAGSVTKEVRATVHSLRPSEQRTVLRVVAPHLRGDERETLKELAMELGLIDHALALCDSRFWWRRLEGARLLTMLGGGGNRVLRMAGDPHRLVRAQVAEWCGTNPSATAVATLVGMLGDPDQASRFFVQDALARLNELVTEPLAKELERVQDPTEARAALLVAHAVGDNGLAASLVRLTEHASPGVRAAAYRAMGRTGGPEGGAGFEAALDDESSDVRAAAALAMGELGQWQGAPRVMRLLGDTSWDVRSAAGRSLLLMGPPGQLLLRRAMGDEDRFVADMARHTLDVANVREGQL